MNKDKELEQKLKILKQTRPRNLMPRPTIFKDKTKYNRKRQKVLIKKEINRDE